MLFDKVVITKIALGICGLLWLFGFMKKLRHDKLLIALLIITFLIAIFGLIIRSPYYQLSGGNAADFLFGPFIYVSSYAVLRMFYKKAYGIEPTYERGSWFDYNEGRKQNWVDIMVHIVPMMLSVIIPLLITEIQNRF